MKTHSEINSKEMKLLKNAGFAAALVCTTLLLITVFTLFFSYAGCSSSDENTPAKVPVTKINN
jgi:hypothetical protein